MRHVVGALVGQEEGESRLDQLADLVKCARTAARKKAFSFANAISIGLKSGL
jgi:hypothetical protein